MVNENFERSEVGGLTAVLPPSLKDMEEKIRTSEEAARKPQR